MRDQKPTSGAYVAPHRSLAAKELRRARRAVEHKDAPTGAVTKARRLTTRSY